MFGLLLDKDRKERALVTNANHKGAAIPSLNVEHPRLPGWPIAVTNRQTEKFRRIAIDDTIDVNTSP